MKTTVSFSCSCSEMLCTTFNTDMYNYHTVRCVSCGTVYEVSRPSIPVRWNLTRSDEQWLDENGFELPKELEGRSGSDRQQYLQKYGKLASRKVSERK